MSEENNVALNCWWWMLKAISSWVHENVFLLDVWEEQMSFDIRKY
jgi:hypothetical protein